MDLPSIQIRQCLRIPLLREREQLETMARVSKYILGSGDQRRAMSEGCVSAKIRGKRIREDTLTRGEEYIFYQYVFIKRASQFSHVYRKGLSG